MITYKDRLASMRRTKLEQTYKKREQQGYMDADDYGTIPFYESYCFRPVANSADGGFHGYAGMCENFCNMLDKHRAYVDPMELLCGRWMDMLKTNLAVRTGVPETFIQVCQWVAYFNCASRIYTRDGAGFQMDDLLYPYYKRDVEKGILDDETAKFIIADLLLIDPHYYQLSGADENGRDMTNRLSYLILEAAHDLNIAANLTVRVHKNSDRQFLLTAVNYLFTDRNGWPRFCGDDALVSGYMKNGVPRPVAVKRIAVGCNWMCVPGIEFPMNDLVKINLAKVLEAAMEDMAGDGGPSCEKLFALFSGHLRQAVDVVARGINLHLDHQWENTPELVMNLMLKGTLERGLDISQCAELFTVGVDGAGLAVVADSFAALQERVEREGALSWEDVSRHLKSDFAGADGERARLMLASAPKYCQGGSLGDKWAGRITELFTGLVSGHDMPGSRRMVPGWFSWSNTIEFGRHVLVKRAFATGQVMVVLVTGTPIFPRKHDFVAELLRRHPEITTIVQNVNGKFTNLVLSADSRVLYGSGKIEDVLCGYRFRISPKSFYQINPEQTEKLYSTAIGYLGLTGGETVVDAYCGTGTIGIAASGGAKRVIGVELNGDAVRDAKENAKLNGIENIEFYKADAGAFMVDMAQSGVGADAVIMDPPRAGSTVEFMSSVVTLAPKRVVYVSCDPETLARDLRYFTRNGYEVKRIQPVDMFPHTSHVETVCLLSKLHSEHHIEVNLNLDEMDLTASESKATYEEIKAWVLEQTGMNVSHLYIAQVKRKNGIIERENYNKPKNEDAARPQCPPDKEKAIMEALKHFGMLPD